jgi:predicted CoA-binding protein
VKKTAVIGASPNPDRYSYKAVQALVKSGFDCVAIGLKQGQIDGIPIQLHPIDTSTIDTVSLYVGPKNQQAWREMILKIHPTRVIFNPGTENPEFESELIRDGITVEHACTLVLLSTGQF